MAVLSPLIEEVQVRNRRRKEKKKDEKKIEK
jgi:hypothetical protein